MAPRRAERVEKSRSGNRAARLVVGRDRDGAILRPVMDAI